MLFKIAKPETRVLGVQTRNPGLEIVVQFWNRYSCLHFWLLRSS